MNIDDVLAAGADDPTSDPDEMGRFIDALVDADDLTDNERGVLCAGYMGGMAHALAIVAKTRDPADIVGEMMAKEAAWDTKAYL